LLDVFIVCFCGGNISLIHDKPKITYINQILNETLQICEFEESSRPLSMNQNTR